LNAGKLYHTADAAKEFAHSIAVTLREFQDHRIMCSPWFGMGGDGSADKAKKEKHTLVVRYIDQIPAEIAWALQSVRFRNLEPGFGELPAAIGASNLSPLEKLALRQGMLKKGPVEVVTEYYDLPSVSIKDSRDGHSHDSQAMIRAYAALFEERGLLVGFNSWKQRLSNVNFDGAMMGERDGAVGEMRRTVDAGEALVATWAQVSCKNCLVYLCVVCSGLIFMYDV
jgi:hypothetical protein